MLNSYVPVLIMIGIATAIGIVMAGASFFLGPKKPTEIKSSQYECGVTPVGTARERFPVKFYLIAMLFIVFDIETVFLYPWAVTYHNQSLAMKSFYFGEMAVFVAILFMGYFYILGKGALDWDDAENAPKNPDIITPEIRGPRPSIRFGNENSGAVNAAKTPAHNSLPAYGASAQEQYQRTPITDNGEARRRALR